MGFGGGAEREERGFSPAGYFQEREGGFAVCVVSGGDVEMGSHLQLSNKSSAASSTILTIEDVTPQAPQIIIFMQRLHNVAMGNIIWLLNG